MREMLLPRSWAARSRRQAVLLGSVGVRPAHPVKLSPENSLAQVFARQLGFLAGFQEENVIFFPSFLRK